MNADKQGELLSALMDGEASEFELRQLLAAVDDAGCETWSRWHLVQDVLHGHASLPQTDADFSARIQAAIDEVIETAPVVKRAWLRSLSRVAVAASVALAVVGGWQVWQQSGGNLSGQAQVANNSFSSVATPVSDDFRMVAPEVRYSYPQQGYSQVQPVADTFSISRAQFNRMMARHHQLAAGANVQGLSPYSSMVDFRNSDER